MRGLILEVVDYDADGVQDVVVADALVIRFARGLGDGRFQIATTVTLPANTQTRDFSLGDVSGDGLPDLVFGAAAGLVDTVRVAVNDGAGGFGAPATLENGDNIVEQVELHDVDGDGLRDILTMSGSAQLLVVHRNTATGFAPAQTYSLHASLSTQQFAVGDMTGDGKPDVVVTTRSGTVNVVANNGDGTFGAPASYPTPVEPWGLVLADLDEDGKLDVVAGTQQTSLGQLSVLLNDGTGGLGAATSYPLTNGGFAPRVLAAADVDGDGHLDVAATQTNGDHVYLFPGTGTGQLGTPFAYHRETADAVALRDLDSDARADMVVLGTAIVSAHLNEGTAMPFRTRETYGFGNGAHNFGARLLDLDGAAGPDIVWFREDSAVTLLTTTAGSFGTPTTVAGTIPSYRALTTDLDNDGRRDLLLVGSTGQSVMNPGDGSLIPRSPHTFSPPVTGAHAASADLDGNGIRDLVVGGTVGAQQASAIHFYPGLGDGTFGTGVMAWSGPAINGMTVGDLDGDGKPDIVADTYEDGFRQEVVLATGNGMFGPPAITMHPDLPRQHLYARDLNADGKLDVLGYDQDAVIAMLGNGDGTFGVPLRSAATSVKFGTTSDLAFADFNGDGHLDLAAPFASALGIMLGRGDGTFHEPLRYDAAVPVSRISMLSVGDVDEDGYVDVLVNNTWEQVSVLRGRCL